MSSPCESASIRWAIMPFFFNSASDIEKLNLKITFPAQSPFSFEELYRAFVLFCPFPRVKGAEVFPLAGLRIYLARIETVLTGLQFSNHFDFYLRAMLTSRTSGPAFLFRGIAINWSLLLTYQPPRVLKKC